MTAATDQQRAPIAVPGAPSVHDQVAAALMERKAFGLAKYGNLLTAGNGRNPAVDECGCAEGELDEQGRPIPLWPVLDYHLCPACAGGIAA